MALKREEKKREGSDQFSFTAKDGKGEHDILPFFSLLFIYFSPLIFFSLCSIEEKRSQQTNPSLGSWDWVSEETPRWYTREQLGGKIDKETHSWNRGQKGRKLKREKRVNNTRGGGSLGEFRLSGAETSWRRLIFQ